MSDLTHSDEVSDAVHGPWSDVEVPCPCCEGAGEWDEGPLPASSGASEPDYRQVICPECSGTGRVMVDPFSASITLDDLENMHS